jgi:hypothetical protein
VSEAGVVIAPRVGGLARPVPLAAAALVALAVAIQVKFGMMGDVAWLINCNERWLDGAVAYRDFIEINPPASLLLYWPAVAAARVAGLPAEAVVSGFGFLLAFAALGFGAWVLRGIAGPAPLLAAVFAFVVLPGETFCERDHLAALLGAPLLAVTLARAEGVRVSLLAALTAGLAAGAMAAVKPPYALIGVLTALFLLARIGWRAVLKAPEYYAAAAFGLAYVTAVGPLFPDYVAHVLPIGVEVHVPARLGLSALLASPGALIVLLIAATAALAAGYGGYSSGFAVAGLAALGAALAYVAQGKGWVYQAVPAAMFATLAGGFALHGQERRAAALALAAGTAGVATPLLGNFGLGWVLGLAIGFGLEAARGSGLRLARLAPIAFAAAAGMAAGACTIERPPTPALERTLAGLGPHLKLATLSEDLGLAFPLTRRIGAEWVLRSHSLIVSSAVRFLLSRHPGDAALKARLQPFADDERAGVLADIAANRPDALLVGPLRTRLHADLMADPRVRAILADYVKVETETRPDYAAELWLRRDFARAKSVPVN